MIVPATLDSFRSSDWNEAGRRVSEKVSLTENPIVESSSPNAGPCESGDSDHRVGRFGVALRGTGIRELSLVRLSVDGEEVCLDGEVASYYVKQVATEAVRPFAAGMQIRNRLRVNAEDRPDLSNLADEQPKDHRRIPEH